MRRKIQSWLSWLWGITNRHLMGLPVDIFSLNDGARHVDITRHARYVIFLYLLNTMTLADVSNCMLTLLPFDSLTLLHAFSSNCTTLISCVYYERSRFMCHHIGLFKTTRLIVSHQVWEQAVNGKRWELQDGCKLCIYSRADAASAQIENLELICPTPSAPLNPTSNGIRCPMLELQ